MVHSARREDTFRQHLTANEGTRSMNPSGPLRCVLIVAGLACILLSTFVVRGDEDVRRAETLAQVLRSTDYDAWSKALTELASMGPDAAPALDALLVFLASDEHSSRLAATAIYNMGATPEHAIPYLAAQMHRQHVGQWGAQIHVPRTGRLLASGLNPICLALSNAGAPAVPAIVPLLKSEDSSVRAFSAITLGLIGRSAMSAAPALRPLLRDLDNTVRAMAAWSIGEVGGVTADVVPELIAMVKQRDEFPRAFAIHALGFGGADAASAVELIIEYVKETVPSRDTCGEAELAIRALGRLAKSAESAAPILKSLVQNERVEANLRIVASVALAGASPEAERGATVKFLIEQSASGDARLTAACGLAELGVADAVPVLIQFMMSDNSEARAMAAHAAANLGQTAAPAAIYLKRMATYDMDSAVRAAARGALRQIEREPRSSQ